MSRSTAFRVMGVKCQHFVECVAAASPTSSFSGSEFALGALKAMGPGVRGKRSLGTPALARQAAGQRLRGAGRGEGSTSGFLQSRCSPWKAFLASGKCGPPALCLAWPWRGPVRLTTGPPLPSGTSEKNERQPRRRGWCRLPLPVWTGQQKGRRGPRPTCCFRGRMRTSVRPRDALSAVLVVTSRFPKRAGNKHPSSSFLRMEFCCKEKRDSNPTGSGGKAAWGVSER